MHLHRRLSFASMIAGVCLISLPTAGFAESRVVRAVRGFDYYSAADSLESGTGIPAWSVLAEHAEAGRTTTTGRVITADDIRNLPVRGAEAIVALQPGVVLDRRSGELFVRGGAADQFVYYVDGVPMQDAFSGQSAPIVGAASIDNISLTTGGLGAEYGWGMSGAALVSTSEGGRRLHGSAEAITDNFHGDRADYNVYALALNGPLFPNSDRLTFAASGERGWAGGASLGTWKWNGKLRWKPTENIVARVGGFALREDFRSYLRSYFFDVAHAPRTVERNSAWWAGLTHSLGPRTSYDLLLYGVQQDSKTGDGVYFDNLWGYSRPQGSSRYDATSLFWAWDDMNLDPDSLAAGKQYRVHTPIRDSVYTITLPDGSTIQKSFVIGGDEGAVWDDFFHAKASYIGGKASLVSQLGARHSLAIGGEFQRHTLRLYHHLFPMFIFLGRSTGFQDADYYGFDALGSSNVDSGLNGAKHPVSIAGYVQDRLTFSDMSISAGLRLDYYDYNAYGLRSLTNPLDPDNYMTLIDTSTTLPPSTRDSLAQEAGRLTASDLAKVKTHVELSPRLGASYQVPSGPLLHFAFGKYFQRPDYGTLYTNLDYLEYKVKTGGYSYTLANANLRPASLTSWELGVQHRFADLVTVDLTGYYKQSSDLTDVVVQPAAPSSFTTYRNVRGFSSRGLEVQLAMRRQSGLAGALRYTLQSTDAGQSYFGSLQNIAWTVTQPRRFTGPVRYDQRHTLTAIVDARLGNRKGPNLGDFYPLERFGMNLVFSAASGFPYAPTTTYNSLSLNAILPAGIGKTKSMRIPATYRLDLKADKSFSLGGTNLDLYLWVLNVFDRANVVDVYSATGSPVDDGWLSSADGQAFVANHRGVSDASGLTAEQKYRLREQDPLNYDIPRQIRVGLVMSF